jgi:hypothetical protein
MPSTFWTMRKQPSIFLLMCLQNFTVVTEINTHFFICLRALLLPKNVQGRTRGFTISTGKLNFSLCFVVLHGIKICGKRRDHSIHSSFRKHTYLVSFIPMYHISHYRKLVRPQSWCKHAEKGNFSCCELLSLTPLSLY